MTTKKSRKEYVQPEEVFDEPLTIGDLLESIRICNLEVTPSQMARELGMSRQHYNGIVSGKTLVSVSKAAEYAELLEHSDKLFIEIALQDLLRRSNIEYKVEVS